MEEKSRGQKSQLERLAGYILRLGAVAAVLAFCWYFSNVLVYIAAAFVVSLVGQPLMYLLKIPHIKGRRLPDWLLATFTLLIIAAVAILVITQVIPVVTGIVKDASLLGAEGLPKGDFRHSINQWVVSLFPTLGADFDIVTLLFQQLKQMTDVSSISGVIGSVASVVTDVVIGVFSVVFISFSSSRMRPCFPVLWKRWYLHAMRPLSAGPFTISSIFFPVISSVSLSRCSVWPSSTSWDFG